MTLPLALVTCQKCRQSVPIRQVGGQNFPERHTLPASGRWCMGTVLPVPPDPPNVPAPSIDQGPPKAT